MAKDKSCKPSSDNDLTYNANTNTLTVTTLTGTATQAANLNNHDTDDLSEGSSNLYFTNGRARAAISIGTEGSASGNGSISYNNSTGVLTFTPAASAGTPTAISIQNEATDTQCFPLFGLTATGDVAQNQILTYHLIQLQVLFQQLHLQVTDQVLQI